MPDDLSGLLKTQPGMVDDVAQRILGLARNMRQQMEDLETRLRDLSANAGGNYAQQWEVAQTRINGKQKAMDAKMEACGPLLSQMNEGNQRTDLEAAKSMPAGS